MSDSEETSDTPSTLAEDFAKAKKEIKTLNRLFWIVVAGAALQTGMRFLPDPHAPGAAFGEKANVTGKFQRQVYLAFCKDCATVDDVLSAKPSNENRRAAGDALRMLSKDPVGQALVADAQNRDVRFEADAKGFSSSCSAGALYDPHWGTIGYTLNGMQGVKTTEELRHQIAHELYHSSQGLAAAAGDTKKTYMIRLLTAEAAAYTFAAIMDARHAALTATPPVEINNETVRKSAQQAMSRWLFSDELRPLRQQYLLRYDPTFSDYDATPQNLDKADLKKLATMPDGTDFLPDDATITKIDHQIRKDLYADMLQRKPSNKLPAAPAHDSKETTAAPLSQKSASQEINAAICEKMRKASKVYKL